MTTVTKPSTEVFLKKKKKRESANHVILLSQHLNCTSVDFFFFFFFFFFDFWLSKQFLGHVMQFLLELRPRITLHIRPIKPPTFQDQFIYQSALFWAEFQSKLPN